MFEKDGHQGIKVAETFNFFFESDTEKKSISCGITSTLSL